MKSLARVRLQIAVFSGAVLVASIVGAVDPPAQKSPPPNQAELDKAWKILRSVYEDKVKAATGGGAKQRLVYEILYEAEDNKADKPAYYALLKLAQNLAIMADDLNLTIAAIAIADETFQIDGLGMRIAALEQFAQKDTAAKQYRAIVVYAVQFAEQALADAEIEPVRHLMRIALDAAQNTKDVQLADRVRERNRLIENQIASNEQREALRKAISEKQEALRKDPSDSKANFALGQVESLVVGDWNTALPLLARGDDPKWKGLAERELHGPSSADEEVGLADGWFELAATQKGSSRDALLRHATIWYRKALPGLRGIRNWLTKDRVEKRLSEIEKPVIQQAEVIPPRAIFLDSDSPFASRGGVNRMVMELRYGGTQATERGVGAALYWLAHHQMPDGAWSLQQYTQMCKDKSCTGPGSQESLSAATALGILPFLAAGQTHTSPGPFQRTVQGGINWLISRQKADGDLSADAQSQMYSHGLATIALCEAYGMTKDKTVGAAAQRAINFIQSAQNLKTGGWRYHPREEGDTSVVGWQFMALKSAQMAGLDVEYAATDGTKKWLVSVFKGDGTGGNVSAPAFLLGPSSLLKRVGRDGTGGNVSTPAPPPESPGGEAPRKSVYVIDRGAVIDAGTAGGTDSTGVLGGQFSYQPDGNATPAMTAVGLLCSQHLHAGRADPVIVGGVRYLMANLPEESTHNIYYWYYATQVMHNMADKDWDTWNRKVREILVKEQTKQGCAAGSWDPEMPNRDAWGPYGGRLMMTSLSALTLEVYYRYVPVYNTEDTNPASPAH